MMGHEGMNTDHNTIPAGHKSSRRRGWRIAALRELAAERRTFTARELAVRTGMDILHAQALLASYCRKGELRCVRRGIGGPDPREAIYSRVDRRAGKCEK